MAELVSAIHVFVLSRRGCPRQARAWRPRAGWVVVGSASRRSGTFTFFLS